MLVLGFAVDGDGRVTVLLRGVAGTLRPYVVPNGTGTALLEVYQK